MATTVSLKGVGVSIVTGIEDQDTKTSLYTGAQTNNPQFDVLAVDIPHAGGGTTEVASIGAADYNPRATVDASPDTVMCKLQRDVCNSLVVMTRICWEPARLPANR